MFYVIYNTTAQAYRNEDGDCGSFENAEKFPSPDSFLTLAAGDRFVGPCIEGETR